uniref:Uncharacterized protein n=1 Tax=Utricularia reniformis TaxID=192314 RepID=A0A1Y0B014_9LAMI|nr:hypothetical protein AEK19_MT0516 [Utricularia reniformis]ART30772.1 hypothetical protein AEK19_MT0516 [Utricularia reniformis]
MLSPVTNSDVTVNKKDREGFKYSLLLFREEGTKAKVPNIDNRSRSPRSQIPNLNIPLLHPLP